MTTPSMYEFLVPTVNRMLGNLTALLDKAAALGFDTSQLLFVEQQARPSGE
jgi:hypothetical protein